MEEVEFTETTTADYTEVVEVMQEMKQLQEEQRDISFNVMILLFLVVALLGVLIGQGFVKFFKR